VAVKLGRGIYIFYIFNYLFTLASHNISRVVAQHATFSLLEELVSLSLGSTRVGPWNSARSRGQYPHTSSSSRTPMPSLPRNEYRMNSAAIISGSVVYKMICQNVRSYGVNPLLPTSCTQLRILVDLQLLGKIWL
jgi:hypothetical protein